MIKNSQIKAVIDTTAESRYNKMELLAIGLEKAFNLPLVNEPEDLRGQIEMVLQVSAALANQRRVIAVIGNSHEEWALFVAARVARINCGEFEDCLELQETKHVAGIQNPVLREIMNKARI